MLEQGCTLQQIFVELGRENKFREHFEKYRFFRKAKFWTFVFAKIKVKFRYNPKLSFCFQLYILEYSSHQCQYQILKLSAEKMSFWKPGVFRGDLEFLFTDCRIPHWHGLNRKFVNSYLVQSRFWKNLKFYEKSKNLTSGVSRNFTVYKPFPTTWDSANIVELGNFVANIFLQKLFLTPNGTPNWYSLQ